MSRRTVRRVHLAAALTAYAIILTFWTSTVAVELFGSTDAIAITKRAITWGLFVLVPILAITGITGARMAGASSHPRVVAKKGRMAVIGGVGLLVLVPSAIYLAEAASDGHLGLAFHVVQAVELMAGGTNLVLMGLNVRDGLQLSGRLRRVRTSSRRPSSRRPSSRPTSRRPSAAG